jgi:hypothetical protein
LSLAFNDSLDGRKDNKRQVGVLLIVPQDTQGVFIDSDAAPHNSGGRASLLAQARAHVTRRVNFAQDQAHQTIQDAHTRAQELKQTTTVTSNVKNKLSKVLVFAQSDGSIGLMESSTGFGHTDMVNKVQIKPNLMPGPLPALGLTVDSAKGLLYFWQSPGPNDFRLIESNFAGTDQREVPVLSSDQRGGPPWILHLSISSILVPDRNELLFVHMVSNVERPSDADTLSLIVAHVSLGGGEIEPLERFPGIQLQPGTDANTVRPVVASDIASDTWAVWWGDYLYRFAHGERQDLHIGEPWEQSIPASNAPVAIFLDEERGRIYWLFCTGYSLDGTLANALSMDLLVTDSLGSIMSDPIHYPLGLRKWQSTDLGWTGDIELRTEDGHKPIEGPLTALRRVGMVESLVVDPLSGWAHTFLRVRASDQIQTSTLLLPFRIDAPIVGAPVQLYDYDITQQDGWYDSNSRNGPSFMGFANSNPYLQYQTLNTQKAAQHAGLVQQYQQAVLKKDSAIAVKRQDVQNRLTAKQQEQAKKHDEAQKAHADASAFHQKRIDETKTKLTTTQNNKASQVNAAKEKAASDKANAQAQKDKTVQAERDKAYATHVTPNQNNLDNARKERDKKR